MLDPLVRARGAQATFDMGWQAPFRNCQRAVWPSEVEHVAAEGLTFDGQK